MCDWKVRGPQVRSELCRPVCLWARGYGRLLKGHTLAPLLASRWWSWSPLPTLSPGFLQWGQSGLSFWAWRREYSVHYTPDISALEKFIIKRTGPQSGVRGLCSGRIPANPSILPSGRRLPPATCLICRMGFPKAAPQRWMKGGDATRAAAERGPWWLFNKRPARLFLAAPGSPGFPFQSLTPQGLVTSCCWGSRPISHHCRPQGTPGHHSLACMSPCPATSLRRRHGYHPCFSGGETEAWGSNQPEVMDWAVAQLGWKPQSAPRAPGLLHC